MLKRILLASSLFILSIKGMGQYVQKERDDTVRLISKVPFDSLVAQAALAKGTGSIKGVAFTKPRNGYGFKAPLANRIYAWKARVILFPVTPYLLDYLELKKKENPKRLKFAYIDPSAWRFRLEAITNSTGEFTFPEMRPGKYYLECVLHYTSSGSYDAYTGTGYNSYGGSTDYYQRQYYNVGHDDLLTKFVEIKSDGEVLDIKLK